MALRLLFLAAVLAGGMTAAPAPETPSGAPVRTYHVLTTGNGHGFTLYDESRRRFTAFLDHPYRYVRAPADLTKDGPQRRNLLERFSLGLSRSGGDWMEDWRQTAADYDRQTNIIRASYLPSGLKATGYYFSPFGLELNALVALMRVEPARDGARPPRVAGRARLSFRLGDHPESEDIMKQSFEVAPIPGERLQRLDGTDAWVQTGNGAGALVYLPLSADASLSCAASPASARRAPDRLDGAPVVCAGDAVEESMTLPAHGGWFGVAVIFVEDAAAAPAAAAALRRWQAGRSPESLLARAYEEWASWRKPAPVTFRTLEERKLWRQSEAVLRMSQVREPNLPAPNLRTSHGMILASLAPGHWATGWVRDGLYSTAALARTGHYEEAKASLDFFLNAAPVGLFKKYAQGADYRISVTRYYGSGQEEADHSGDPAPNVELDGWGLFLWAARQYVDASGDTAWLSSRTRQGSVYEAMLEGVAGAIQKNLETLQTGTVMRADSSIWEVHDDHKKHFAFTTLMAARGLEDFAAIARRAGRDADADKYEKLAADTRAGFARTFGTPDGVVGALEPAKDTDVDGAVVEALSMGVVDPRSPLGQATLAGKIARLATPIGGYKRNGGTDPYAVNEWPFIDLRLAGVLFGLGRAPEGEALIDRNVDQAARNFHLIPEEYVADPKQGKLGSYHGSIPMVGYGAGVYELSLLEREKQARAGAAAGLQQSTAGRAVPTRPVTTRRP